MKSDPDYEKDFKDANGVINQIWDVIDGFTFGNIVRKHSNDTYFFTDIEMDILRGFNDWELKGYWAFVNDEDNEIDFGEIWKSIHKKDQTSSFHELNLSILSEVELAFCIKSLRFCLLLFSVADNIYRWF